jgi:hypothetical protein
MKRRIIILHGDNEHVCIRNDDETCSSVCPCRVNKEGLLAKELIAFPQASKELHCAIRCEGKEFDKDNASITQQSRPLGGGPKNEMERPKCADSATLVQQFTILIHIFQRMPHVALLRIMTRKYLANALHPCG